MDSTIFHLLNEMVSACREMVVELRAVKASSAACRFTWRLVLSLLIYTGFRKFSLAGLLPYLIQSTPSDFLLDQNLVRVLLGRLSRSAVRGSATVSAEVLQDVDV